MTPDLIITLGSMLISPTFSLLKSLGLFGGNKPVAPEETMSNLATTKPESLGPYVEGLAKYYTAMTSYFNRDVVGEISQWVRDFRASIRPSATVIAGATLITMVVLTFVHPGSFDTTDLPNAAAETITGVRLTCESILGSWVGDRISIRGK